LLIKALFHRYITEIGCHNLIEIYNRVFSDKLYEAANLPILRIPQLSDEWCKERVADYKQKIRVLSAIKAGKRPPQEFAVGEIVGARDRENNWWMSRVLAVFTYEQHVVYYVEFLGWGEQFNEFIPYSRTRIRRFNPKVHRYFRPVYARVAPASQSVPVPASRNPEDDEETPFDDNHDADEEKTPL
jgi:hypothetical protein